MKLEEASNRGPQALIPRDGNQLEIHSFENGRALPDAAHKRAKMSIPRHMRGRREKVFGEGRPLPLDREAKLRILVLARAMMRKTEKRKHYGRVTAKALAVLQVLLFQFHNARSGLCFPSYDKIGEKADCAHSTVAKAIEALEACGILSWVNRLKRVREISRDLFGNITARVRVLRTSNAYRLKDPNPNAERANSSKFEITTGTPNQGFYPKRGHDLGEAKGGLQEALRRLGEGVRRESEALARPKPS